MSRTNEWVNEFIYQHRHYIVKTVKSRTVTWNVTCITREYVQIACKCIINALFVFYVITTRKRLSIADRISWAHPPPYHAHTRWNSPLPLASAAPRCAGLQLIMSHWKPITTTINDHQWILIGRCIKHTFWHWPLTLTYDLTRRAMVWSTYKQQIKVIDQLVQRICWRQMDGQTNMTDRITFRAES